MFKSLFGFFNNQSVGEVFADEVKVIYQDQMLSQAEPKIEASVTRPFVPTLVGKRVVVKEVDYYDVCIKIEFENQETFGGEGYHFYKALVEVYEVSSENLLTSKK